MATLKLKDLVFKVDSTDFLKEYPLKHWKYSKVHKHLYYNFKKEYTNYIELVKGPLPPSHIYILKNKDPMDLTKKNIKYVDLTPNKNILSSNEGHKVGYRMVNPYWRVKSNNGEYYMMYIKEGKYVKFSTKHLNLVKNRSWFLSTTGYATTHYNGKTTYLHKLILDEAGYCSQLLKVQHTNDNKLDNRIPNIKIINHKPESLKGKKKRKINFKKIDAIMPTWISYTQQYRNHGDYFKVSVKVNGKTITKRTTKSLKVVLEKKLVDVLIMRAVIINDNPVLLDRVIDNKTFTDMTQFIKHTKKLINKYAQRAELDVDINKLDFSSLVKNKLQKKQRNFEEFPEETSYQPSNLPKYTIYIPAKGNKGSFIEYKKVDRDNNKVIRFKTTSRKDVSLDDKFKEIRKKIKDIVGKKKKYVLKSH